MLYSKYFLVKWKTSVGSPYRKRQSSFTKTIMRHTDIWQKGKYGGWTWTSDYQ